MSTYFPVLRAPYSISYMELMAHYCIRLMTQDKTHIFSGSNGNLLETLNGGEEVIPLGDIDGDSTTDIAVKTADNKVLVYSGRLPNATRDIEINIKPFNRHNLVYPGSRGAIWVAVLSNTNPVTPFEPLSQVDISSVLFGPAGASVIWYRTRDANSDGLQDLLLRFKISETGISCNETSATLVGKTYDNVELVGTDNIKTIGCKRNLKKVR